jgi:small-conductance mechanosensitive channel
MILLQIDNIYSAFLDFVREFQHYLLPGIATIAVLVAAWVAQRVAKRTIRNYAKRAELDEHVTNLLHLASRIMIYLVVLFLIFAIFQIDATVLVAVSTFSGAAIGFASTQTLGNFLAGLYIIVSRPFLVGDYVRIGEDEGMVKEITINFTRLHTTTHNILRLPNKTILDRKVTIYSKDEQVDYTLPIGFNHSVGQKDIEVEIIPPAIDEFYKKYKEKLSSKPDFFMLNMDRLERKYGIRLRYHEDYIEEFFDLSSELMEDVVERWDSLQT